MVEKIDIAMSAMAMCAISLIVPQGEWSIFRDLRLCCVLVAAYLVLLHFRPNTPSKEVSVPDKSFDETQSNLSTHIALLQRYAVERNVSGAMRTFRLLQQSGEYLSSLMYNAVLQAHINCGNIQAAEDWMNDIKEAGKADQTSFHILIKALIMVRASTKALDLLKEMKMAGVQPSIDIFNDVLSGLAQEDRFSESAALIHIIQNICPSGATLDALAKLINRIRDVDPRSTSVQKILAMCNDLDVNVVGDTLSAKPCISSDSPVSVALPRLAAVVSQACHIPRGAYLHEICVTGSLAQIKAVRRTTKQLGFLDKTENEAWPLDGHWETDHGLTVVVEGKLVRWSGQRASRLRFASEDRRACLLRLYGQDTRGQLVSSGQAPGATKTLRWDNGDVWNSYDGRAIRQHTLFSQSMTKTSRDTNQDVAYRARASAVLKCTSKQSLGVPYILENAIIQFLGNDLYYVRIRFESKWTPSNVDESEDDMPSPVDDMDICNSISSRHQRVGVRHCWAERSGSFCGQRTLANGKEIDEDIFGQHIKLVTWA